MSGPWRSPAATGSPGSQPAEVAPAQQPSRRTLSPLLGTGSRRGTATAAPAPAPEPVPIVPADPELRRPPRRRHGLALGMLFGALVAVGIVAVALVIRPATLDAPPPETAPAPLAADSAGAGAPQTVTVPPGADLRLRIGAGMLQAREAAIIAALEAGGAPVEAERVDFRVMASRVGYFHEDDRMAAEDLAANLAPVVGATADALAVRDYSALMPNAQPGRLDVWIAE